MKHANDIFKALGDEIRSRILNLFLVANGSLCVCEIVDALKLPQYRISKHLAVLRNAGLIDVKKEGTWAYYFLNTSDASNKMLFSFLKNFLRGKVSEEDRENLRLRLLLRGGGKCVVGFVSEKKLIKMIKLKMEEIS
ncbi:MAG TPA: metalloregulator ArsR/SmtB family transcription factor [Thermodesulfobacteriota bacterium]|nr:metalloregulator ArsR/SmtB family transcription factor [Thermodesulfobacteriota bacterium]